MNCPGTSAASLDWNSNLSAQHWALEWWVVGIGEWSMMSLNNHPIPPCPTKVSWSRTSNRRNVFKEAVTGLQPGHRNCFILGSAEQRSCKPFSVILGLLLPINCNLAMAFAGSWVLPLYRFHSLCPIKVTMYCWGTRHCQTEPIEEDTTRRQAAFAVLCQYHAARLQAWTALSGGKLRCKHHLPCKVVKPRTNSKTLKVPTQVT